MRKFERIRVEKGQAYIRDTGVAVLDILYSLRDGDTLHQLLEKYSDLTDEDIVEALVFSIEDLRSYTSMFIGDARSPLSSIVSASAILTEDNIALSETDREKIGPMIEQSARKLNNMWWFFMHWMSVKYWGQPREAKAASLIAILNEVKSDLELNNFGNLIEVSSLEEITTVSDNGYLSSLFTALLQAFVPITPRLKYGGKIIVSRQKDADLYIEVIREFESPKPTTFNVEKFIWDTLHVSLAVLILRSHGSDLYVHVKETDITFAFNLPVWQENS